MVRKSLVPGRGESYHGEAWGGNRGQLGRLEFSCIDLLGIRKAAGKKGICYIEII